jgi:hypothetical protein
MIPFLHFVGTITIKEVEGLVFHPHPASPAKGEEFKLIPPLGVGTCC